MAEPGLERQQQRHIGVNSVSGTSQQQVGGRTGCGDCALGSLKGAPGRTESAGRESRVQERTPAICVIQ